MYRKLKADYIFNGRELISGNHVLVLQENGIVKDIIKEEDAGDTENYKGILSPGFINCHCHIELSHLKNAIPKHTGLVNFVQLVMKQRHANAEIIYTAMENAEAELFSSGTVAIGDICNTRDSISLKKQSHLYWHNFIEVSGFVKATASKRFVAAKELLCAFKELSGSCSITPHAPYSVSQKLFELINTETAESIISIHNQETEAEDELYKYKTGGFLKLYDNLSIDITDFLPSGNSALQTWLPYFNKNHRIISVHNTFSSDQDIALARNTFLCICVNANLYIEDTLPPVKEMIANKSKIVLGTDSYASNDTLNLMDEMKTLHANFPEIGLADMLTWSTSNGAEALGISDKYGSLEAGKKPGIVLTSSESGHFDKTAESRLIIF